MSNNTGHPKGLYVLFITEMWERFSYYGMRAIFTLFLAKALLFDKGLTSNIYGSYTGLVYLTPLVGGYMADRFWGNRKSIIIGGILMAIGQFLMFLSGSFYQNIELATPLMIAGLFLLIVGNGFFKPNISTMVGQLYPEGDKRIDPAFTIFYMGINLGAFLSPLICGTLGDTDNPADFKWGFLAACIGMILSLVIFIWLKDKYIVSPEGQPIGTAPNSERKENIEREKAPETNTSSAPRVALWMGIFIAIFSLFGFTQWFGMHISEDWGIGAFIFAMAIAAPGFIITDPSLSKIEKERIWAIYIIAFFVIFFWSAFEQAGASLTFFADEQTDRSLSWHIPAILAKGVLAIVILGLSYLISIVWKRMKNEAAFLKEVIIGLLLIAIIYFVYLLVKVGDLDINQIPASYFQSINALAIVIFAPLFSWIWGKLAANNQEPASPYKQAIGLFLLAVGYVVIAIGVKGLEPGTKVSMMWLVSLYVLHTFGELCLSPIGLGMVVKLSPVRLASLLMGVWFLSTATSNKFAGTLSSLYPEPMINVAAFADIQEKEGINVMKISDEKVKEGDKFVVKKLRKFNVEKIEGKAYLTADTTVVKFNPEKHLRVGGKVTVKLEDINGVSCFSKELINYNDDPKLKGDANSKYKDDVAVTIAKVSETKVKSFAGFPVTNLYQFFWIFIVMAGVASAILFILSKWLLKLMHGVR